MKAYYTTQGDYSVGMFPREGSVDLLDDEFDSNEHREFTRQTLKKMFEELYDEAIHVHFDDELGENVTEPCSQDTEEDFDNTKSTEPDSIRKIIYEDGLPITYIWKNKFNVTHATGKAEKHLKKWLKKLSKCSYKNGYRLINHVIPWKKIRMTIEKTIDSKQTVFNKIVIRANYKVFYVTL